jgi:hypothetical protein
MVIKSLLGFGMMIVTNTEVMRPRDPNPAQNRHGSCKINTFKLLATRQRMRYWTDSRVESPVNFIAQLRMLRLLKETLRALRHCNLAEEKGMHRSSYTLILGQNRFASENSFIVVKRNTLSNHITLDITIVILTCPYIASFTL